MERGKPWHQDALETCISRAQQQSMSYFVCGLHDWTRARLCICVRTFVKAVVIGTRLRRLRLDDQ